MAGGRPLVVAWAEDAATLGRLYRAEGDAQVRPRLQALWLLRQGRGVGAVAAVVGVNYRTVQDWLAWYRRGGLAQVRRHRRAGKGRAAYLSAEQQAQLVAEAATGHFFTVVDAVRWVAETFGVAYTPKGMHRLLTRLGCRKKVPRPINPKTSPEAQAAWKTGAWSLPSARPA
jgi:transposase